MIELDGLDFQSPSFLFSQEFLGKKNAAEVRGLGEGRSSQIQFQSSPSMHAIPSNKTLASGEETGLPESAGKEKQNPKMKWPSHL